MQRIYTLLLLGIGLLLTPTALALVAPQPSVSGPVAPAVPTVASAPPLAAMTAALLTAYLPLVPLVHAVVENDDYEYGAVDAPIGLAVGGGILAILTALLPIALRGGEEAFEEIKDRDAGTFGTRGSKDVLQGKKKKR
jgi:hypothetical protein